MGPPCPHLIYGEGWLAWVAPHRGSIPQKKWQVRSGSIPLPSPPKLEEEQMKQTIIVLILAVLIALMIFIAFG